MLNINARTLQPQEREETPPPSSGPWSRRRNESCEQRSRSASSRQVAVPRESNEASEQECERRGRRTVRMRAESPPS